MAVLLERVADQVSQFEETFKKSSDPELYVADYPFDCIEVVETDNAYYLTTGLPHFVKEELIVFVQGNRLTMEATKNFPYKTEEGLTHFIGKKYGHVFQWKHEINPGNVRASFHDDVLRIRILKTQQERRENALLQALAAV